MNRPPPLSQIINPNTLPREAHAHVLESTEAERLAISQSLGLSDLRQLSADLELTRSAGGAIRVTGRIRAEIVQPCVVTLLPVLQELDDPVDRRFVPEQRRREMPDKAIDIEIDDPEPPDTYPVEGLDVGAMVLEELILRVDPYPRAPGAALPEPSGDDAAAKESPFSALKSLGQGDPS